MDIINVFEKQDDFILDSLKFLESTICSNGCIRAFCISHDIKKITKYDVDKIVSLLKENFIVCFADHIHEKRYKPYFYILQNGIPYIFFYINFKKEFRKEICREIIDKF